MTDVANRSLNCNIRCTSHTALLTCHSVIPALESLDSPMSAVSGIWLSSLNANHQFELTTRGALHSRYALFIQKLSSNQLCGDALSSALQT